MQVSQPSYPRRPPQAQIAHRAQRHALTPPVPFRFSGLNTLGLIFYFFNLLMYLLISLGLVVRAYHFPTAFRASFLHPTESLFIPASMIALGTVLVTTAEYGLAPSGVAATGPWLLDTLVIVFWIYAAGAVAFTVGIYVLVWSTQTFTVQTMTPLWIFPAYPLLLVGPFAAVLTTAPAGADGTRGLQIIVGGVVVQGMGFLLSLTMHATVCSPMQACYTSRADSKQSISIV